MKFVEPQTYLIGFSTIAWDGFLQYLKDTGNDAFVEGAREALASGLSAGEVLCSFFAKLCYKSLKLGDNANVERVRSIRDNLAATLRAGHLSVFEHVNLNFVVTNCSRVFTHELVRHRIGTAFSQTSGRYVRGDEIEFVHDPILDAVKADIWNTVSAIESGYKRLCALSGIDGFEAWCHAKGYAPNASGVREEWCRLASATGFDPDKAMPFALKKKLTSALRRILPNGQANEIGFSVNLRALRHTIQMRTHPEAEREIRRVFGQVFDLVRGKWSEMFADAKVDIVDGLSHVYGMRMQPYEVGADESLRLVDTEDLQAELKRREGIPF